MDTLNRQRDLIEKLVKSNSKFKGNEDLLEDFCSETYKRSYSLLESLDIQNLENYIAKVVNTAILNVLKDNGRIRRRENKYVSSHEILISPVQEKQKAVKVVFISIQFHSISSNSIQFHPIPFVRKALHMLQTLDKQYSSPKMKAQYFSGIEFFIYPHRNNQLRGKGCFSFA